MCTERCLKSSVKAGKLLYFFDLTKFFLRNKIPHVHHQGPVCSISKLKSLLEFNPSITAATFGRSPHTQPLLINYDTINILGSATNSFIETFIFYSWLQGKKCCCSQSSALLRNGNQSLSHSRECLPKHLLPGLLN